MWGGGGIKGFPASVLVYVCRGAAGVVASGMLRFVLKLARTKAGRWVGTAAAIGLFGWGVWGGREAYRCVRALLPAGPVSYTEATTESLSDYVQLTGIVPKVVDVKGVKAEDGAGYASAYVPVEAGEGESDKGRGRVLLWLPGGASAEELERLGKRREVKGFVDGRLDGHAGGLEAKALHGIARGKAEDVWVVEVRRPSWVRAGWRTGAPWVVGLVVVLLGRGKGAEEEKAEEGAGDQEADSEADADLGGSGARTTRSGEGA